MNFIKKRETDKTQQAQPKAELLEVIEKNCTGEDLAIFAKLVQNPLYKKLALDYLKANLK